MPDKRHIPGTADDWMYRAKADLALARAPLPDGALYEDLVFHAQQAAEKAIKAVYVQLQLRFPYTHNIGTLLSGLSRASIEVPNELRPSAELTVYASESRYPYCGEAVDENEYLEALHLAEKVVFWAETIIH